MSNTWWFWSIIIPTKIVYVKCLLSLLCTCMFSLVVGSIIWGIVRLFQWRERRFSLQKRRSTDHHRNTV